MSARRLDFCVPHWKEEAIEMEPLLDSIKIQRSVDLSQVGVIIAYDGPEATGLPLDEWRERYPFAIEDVHPEKGGVSHTRNAALDASEAEFVLFMDADDCLMDNRGLYFVFREMDADPDPREMAMLGVPSSQWEPGFDFMVADFIEETKNPETGKIEYVPHMDNMTFVHSQVARRQWLIDNDLRFNDSLHVHEDSFWVILCRETVKPWRGKRCTFPWMLWCWRDGSVCRGTEKYILKTMPNMLLSNEAAVSELIKRAKQDRAASYFTSMVWDVYFTCCKAEWKDEENKEYRDILESKFAGYFRRRRDLWDGMSEQEKLMISQGVRQRSIMEGMRMEDITINAWLDRILELYPE